MKKVNKLSFDTSSRDCILRLAGGYPGPLHVLARLLDDRMNGAAGYADLHRLDDAGIYGPHIWVAYKDVCGEDLEVFRTALRDGTLRAQLQASPRCDPDSWEKETP